MRQLRFVGLAEDGTSIVVVDATGEQFALPVDEQVRAAARGDAVRLGQLAVHAESSLRPAEIQARVRAGDSVEEVARVASVPLERVLPFARAVLLERALIAEEARAAICRPWESGETHVLGELVDARLAQRGYDPEQADWDSARRENGTWRVTAQFGEGKRAQEAVWIYEPSGRQVRANDDMARQLIAEPVPEPTVSPMASTVEQEEPEPERALAVVRQVRPRTETREDPAHTENDADTEDSADLTAQPVAAPARTKRAAGQGAPRQGAVPSWEDIMFGVRGRQNG